jgi:hypothetical protein
LSADVGAGVDDRHVAGAERLGHQAGVQPDAGGEQMALRLCPDDDHSRRVTGGQQTGEEGCHVAVAVRDVVGNARRRGRLDPWRKWDEHPVGEGDGEFVGHRAAPVTAGYPEAVHRDRWNRLAVTGATGTASRARAARDLKRHDDALARPPLGDVAADGEDLGHALVPEVQRREEGGGAEAHGAIEIAGRDGQGPDDRPEWARRGRRRDAVPPQPAARHERERAHPRARGAHALLGRVDERRAESADPLLGLALEHDAPRDRPRPVGEGACLT